MSKSIYMRGAAVGVLLASLASVTKAETFNIPSGDLKMALDAYASQTGIDLVVSGSDVRGVRTKGARGDLSAMDALSHLLTGTGFSIHQHPSGAIGIAKESSGRESLNLVQPLQLAQAAPARAAVETVTVTSSKLGGADVQSIPIAITALSQEQLTASQTAGGPDLVKQVPNLTFTKTNFAGYSIQIRGIGTQAISVTTDPAVAVAFNDQPFIRNHFFEQEFFDVAQAEVLRGPQGTLYGRNATAGVVNLVSAKPTDQFEAMASADVGNYKNRRLEGMLNIPIVDDRVDLRLAGEWTKRDGYSLNSLTNEHIDGRDLWSGRATIGFKPSDKFTAYFVWEHFQEDDDRLRSSKQLCKRDNGVTEIGGLSTGRAGPVFLSQGCLPTSLYGADAFETPNGLALPYYGGLVGAGSGLSIGNPLTQIGGGGGISRDPYVSATQSTNLRVIESSLDPVYRAKNDTFELNTDYAITPSLTFTSSTGYNEDFLWSTEDYNRFNTAPGIFAYQPDVFGPLITAPDGNYGCADGSYSVGGNHCANPSAAIPTGYFCDPQLGCSDRLVAEDLNEEHSWQLNQEFRLASKLEGPLNFSVGGNFMHYETEENYYVFFNTLTMWAAKNMTGTANNTTGFPAWNPQTVPQCAPIHSNAALDRLLPPEALCLGWIDPNPITNLDGQGHNYFLSKNPYTLNSYAGFGEAYYNLLKDLKLIGGLRWTDDRKHFSDIPSELLTATNFGGKGYAGYGYPVTGVVDQEWREWTGRFAANWTPKLDFTDQTLIYASFAHGYKAGGANPPGAVLTVLGPGQLTMPIHPLTFAPEFINAYELGTKNTLLDGGLTFNANVFFYDYKGYQISEIVDRTALNMNFDATVRGAEVEASYEPLPGLKFNFAGGYQNAKATNGSKAIDLMDRAAGNPDWVVVKPFYSQASNCIIPSYVLATLFRTRNVNDVGFGIWNFCGIAYNDHVDPIIYQNGSGGAASATPVGYPGWDPTTAPNNGEGIDKDLSGNKLPNAPPFTASFSAEYTTPVTSEWAATLRADYYWQDYSWARIFNDNPYDRLRGYTNVNLALILTSQGGWQVMGYVKNVFNVTDITGTFLNSDDSGLTTNVFLTDPRLVGLRVTKNW